VSKPSSVRQSAPARGRRALFVGFLRRPLCCEQRRSVQCTLLRPLRHDVEWQSRALSPQTLSRPIRGCEAKRQCALNLRGMALFGASALTLHGCAANPTTTSRPASASKKVAGIPLLRSESAAHHGAEEGETAAAATTAIPALSAANTRHNTTTTSGVLSSLKKEARSSVPVLT